MVKKIDGKSSPIRTRNIEGTEKVQGAKVGGVGSVKGSGKAEKTAATQGKQKITAENKDALIELVEREAEKMFGSGSLSEEQKEVVKGAVKMAIEGAVSDEKKP